MSNRTRALELARSTVAPLFIDGEWRQPSHDALGGADEIETIDPATGAVITTLAAGSATDVHDAVAAARRAATSWSRATPAARARLLRALAALVEADAAELAAVDTLDNGKPLALTTAVDLPQAVAHLRHQATVAETRTAERIVDAGGAAAAEVYREPVGVVGLITPWNYPLLMVVRALAPALAAGNTVVVKPSELTPISALLLAGLAARAGFPPGVVNVVTGTGEQAGQALASDPRVDLITFTGGRATARRIAAVTEARTLFELGGKAPFVVFDDADLDAAALAATAGAFGNQGQNCMAATRILVHDAVADEFAKRFAEATAAFTVGDGFDRGTRCGPLVSEAHRSTVAGYVDRAVAAGASVLTGGESTGYSRFSPTVLAGVDRGAEAWNEEIFGPVAVLDRFVTDAEGLALANSTRYGLAASVWTADADRGREAAAALQAGVVWVNCYSKFDAAIPFSPRGASGSGTVGGHWGYEGYTALKSVWTPRPADGLRAGAA
ncbi:aldehyde dehydrogenase family protein [Herbiconiux moechotypicola]|uniref:Aminobutyraldehyde dehydrogenase n=1 Tax=Herbiconiux moechotypicola TaxID=637393 RepID=A0ABN3D8N3_9MICO|nr:aldehyde dehydrogenase family protein [Herbiconiux moechotypicola]MCS5728203.1 aldehyde dehydrogenase family protein [Herbiconiux moechotypicola]